MVLFVSPKDVDVGCVVVNRVGWETLRRSVKSVTCARARAEERVPMRRLGRVGVEVSTEGALRVWGEVAEA